MLDNGVIIMNTNDYWMRWIKAAVIRALKTSAQTGVSLIGTNGLGITDVNWLAVGSASALAGIVSILTSITGLPEVELDGEVDELNH